MLQGRDRDFGDLLDLLFQLAAFLFIILLPVLRTVLQRMRKVGERSPGRPRPRRPALDRWEELLRGEGEAERGGGPPPPSPLERTPPRPRARPRSLEDEPVLEEALEERTIDEARAPLARRPVGATAALGRHVEEEVREDLAAMLLAKDAREAEARARTAAPRPRGPRHLASWRRAIVLTEVLGRPLALRPPRSAAGGAPPGDA